MRFPWPRKTVEQRAQAIVDAADFVVVNDGFENARSGIGQSTQSRDVVFCPGFQAPEQTLSDIVDTNWLGRKIVRALPEAAMQEKILFADPTQAETWQRINAIEGNDDGAFLSAQVLARTHGVSLLILGQDWGGEPSTPADPNAPIEWLEPVRSEDFTVAGGDLCQDRTNARRFGKPDFYRIHGTHRFRGQRIHYSRVLPFYGPSYSDPSHSRNIFKLQGLSALDPVFDVLAQYSLSWAAIAEMIQQGSVPIWRLHGLINGMTKDPAGMAARLQVQQEQVSVVRAILLDAEKNESYSRENVSFADIPEVVKQLTLQVSAAANIPVSELFGRIVSGLGDVGEVEDRKWVRKVATYRTNTLDPKIARIMPGAKYAWQPIMIPSPQERFALEKGYWDMGTTTDAEARKFAEEALALEPLTPEGLAELEERNGARPPIDPSLAGF